FDVCGKQVAVGRSLYRGRKTISGLQASRGNGPLEDSKSECRAGIAAAETRAHDAFQRTEGDFGRALRSWPGEHVDDGRCRVGSGSIGVGGNGEAGLVDDD